MFMFKNLKLFHILLRQLSFQTTFREWQQMTNSNWRENLKQKKVKRNQIGWSFSKAKWKQKVLFSLFYLINTANLEYSGNQSNFKDNTEDVLTADNWLKIITAINFLSWMSHGMSINLDKSHRGQIVLFRNSK